MSRVAESAWAYQVVGVDIDALSDALDAAGIDPAGLSEDDGVSTAWFNGVRPAAMPLDGIWAAVPRADWAEAWKVGLEPIVVGDITVAPPWHAPNGPQLNRSPFTIVIEPGLAFGTGHHETTTACLEMLQELDLLGARVLDIGTGTAVLALAASALGAREVVGVDNDEEAVDVAVENVAAHAVANVSIRLGSCAEAGTSGDVVIANIITDKLLALAAPLVGLVAPGGVLVASGVAVGRIDEALVAFDEAGMTMTARPGVEWALLLGRAPD